MISQPCRCCSTCPDFCITPAFLLSCSVLSCSVLQICDDLIDATYEAQGIYGVALMSEGAWQMVYIDSAMPCFRRAAASAASQWRLLFGTSYDHREVSGYTCVEKISTCASKSWLLFGTSYENREAARPLVCWSNVRKPLQLFSLAINK